MADDSTAVPLGRPTFFVEQTVRGLFAARNGLFLIDPARLEAHLGGDAAESRLLESFTTRGSGAEVCRTGLLVPAFGVEAGYYTVLVRSTETENAITPLTHIVYSTGFVLGTVTGDLVVCNTDRLARRDAAAGSHRGDDPAGAGRPVHVSPGWYSVTVVAGIRESDESPSQSPDGAAAEGWVCAFLLDPQESQPAFTGDLSRTLSFFAG